MDRPYQDAFADGMADVAEDSEWVQKHVEDCEGVVVMKTFDCRLLRRSIVGSKVSAYCQCLGESFHYVAEGAKVRGSSTAPPRLASRLFNSKHRAFGHEICLLI